MKKRFAAALICLCMMLGLLPAAPVSAALASWGDDIDTAWYVSGTSSYHISTPQQLAGLAYLVNTRQTEFLNETVYLDSDIDLAGKEWIPIDWGGWTDKARGYPGFRGVLDGQNHTISNLTITTVKAGANAGVSPVGADEYYSEIGLFGRMDGIVRNLTIDKANITLSDAEAAKVLKAGFVCGTLCHDSPRGGNTAAAGIDGCIVNGSTIYGIGIFCADIFAGYIYNDSKVTKCGEGADANKLTTYKSDPATWLCHYDLGMYRTYNSSSAEAVTITVRTPEELAAIAALSAVGRDFANKTVLIACDLDMSQYEWTGIKAFNGTFDGQGHVISGLRRTTYNSSVGLILTASGATVKNLSVSVNYQTTIQLVTLSDFSLGGIAAETKGDCLIENCSVFGTINSSLSSDASNGGLVGTIHSRSCEIRGCANYASVTGSSAGGLVGTDYYSLTLVNSVNAGSVNGMSAGGLVGYQDGNLSAEACAVAETDSKTGGSLVIYGKYSGGFIGQCGSLSKNQTIDIRSSYCNACVKAYSGGYACAVFNIFSAATVYPLPISITSTYFGGELIYGGSAEDAPSHLFLCFYSDGSSKFSVTCESLYLLAYMKESDGSYSRNYKDIESTDDLSKVNTSGYTWFEADMQADGTGSFYEKVLATYTGFNFVSALNSGFESPIWASQNSSGSVFQHGLPYLSFAGFDSREVSQRQEPVPAPSADIIAGGDQDIGLDCLPYDSFTSAYGGDGYTALVYTATGMTFRVGCHCSSADEYIEFSGSLFHKGDKLTLRTVNSGKTGYVGEAYSYTLTGSEQAGSAPGTLKIPLGAFKSPAYASFSAGCVGYRQLYFNVVFGEQSRMAAEDAGLCSLAYGFGAVSAQTSVTSKTYDIALSFEAAEGGALSVPEEFGASAVCTGNSSVGIAVYVTPDDGYYVAGATAYKDGDKTSAGTALTCPRTGGVISWNTAGSWLIVPVFAKRTYSVSFSGDGFELCDMSGAAVSPSELALTYGDTYQFKVKPTGSLIVKSVAVNGSEATIIPSGQYYEVKPVTGSLSIEVNPVVKPTPTLAVKVYDNSVSGALSSNVVLSPTLSTDVFVTAGQLQSGTVKFYGKLDGGEYEYFAQVKFLPTGQTVYDRLVQLHVPSKWLTEAQSEYKCTFYAEFLGNSSYAGCQSAEITYTFVRGAQPGLTFGSYLTSYAVGESFSITATGGISSYPIVYSSSDQSIAQTYGSGTVTLLKAGSFTITASRQNDLYTLAPVSVTSSVIEVLKGEQAELAFTDETSPRCCGDTFSMAVTGGSGTGAVTYVSSDNSVASVASDGTVTAVGTGKFTITAVKAADSDYNEKSAVSAEITVLKGEQAELSFGSYSTGCTYGGSFFISAYGGSGTGAISFFSSDESVARVSGGRVSLVGVGTFQLTAVKAADTSYNSQSAVSRAITVSPAELDVAVNKLTVLKGQALPGLTVTVSGFVGGDSEAMAGFKRPYAALLGEYDTSDASLSSAAVVFYGGDATANYTFNYNTSAEVEILTEKTALSDFTADKDLSAWQSGVIRLTPANGGVKISLDGVVWADEVILSDEGENTADVFVKRADGTETDGLTIGYRLDNTAPSASVACGESVWERFTDPAAFGLFRSGVCLLEISAEDGGSGVAGVEYLLSQSPFKSASDVDGGWLELTPSEGRRTLRLESDSKQYVYIRVTDAVGNRTVISSEGIVVFSGGSAIPAEATFNPDIPEDIVVSILPAGTTVGSLLNGAEALVEGIDYIEDDGKVTILKEYLQKALTGSSLTLTISFNPLGEEFTGRGDAPETAELLITRHVHVWGDGEVTAEPTDSEDGVMTYTCSGCGLTRTEPIEKLPAPDTGDSGSALWLLPALGAALAALVLVKKKRAK